MTKVGVCGIGCEVCPKRTKNLCPNEAEGCKPRVNKFCKICNCAFEKKVSHCFSCQEFPCELTKQGPISYDFCQYISHEN